MPAAAPLSDDPAQALIEELLRVGLTLTHLLASLIEELPEGAFPGEDNGKVLVEMLIGTCLPAVRAAGEPHCRMATALIGTVRDRVLEDLGDAAALSAAGPYL